jgi:hypothetical protein
MRNEDKLGKGTFILLLFLLLCNTIQFLLFKIFVMLIFKHEKFDFNLYKRLF